MMLSPEDVAEVARFRRFLQAVHDKRGTGVTLGEVYDDLCTTNGDREEDTEAGVSRRDAEAEFYNEA